MSIRLKLKWALLIALLAILGIVSYYTYSLFYFANNIHSRPEQSRFKPFKIGGTNDPEGAFSYTPPKWEGKERVNILLLGGDSRGLKKNEIPRSDTLMVASVDPVSKQVLLFSILRDTYVKIQGHGEERINAALAYGGPELSMRTVSDLLGIPIQYYVYTDFVGFVALVDAIGGIDFEVEKNMKYSDSIDGPEYDINLKKGLQHLDGKLALQYVRFRHDALSDYSRTERQRNFLKVVAEKLQTSGSLIRLPKILSAITPYIETNLSFVELLKLGSLGVEVKAQNMNGLQLPPSHLLVEKNVRGASVISANDARLKKYVEEQMELSTKPKEIQEPNQKGS